jgi:hypothetical protein
MPHGAKDSPSAWRAPVGLTLSDHDKRRGRDLAFRSLAAEASEGRPGQATEAWLRVRIWAGSYRRTDGGFLVYSRGANLKNDGKRLGTDNRDSVC